MAAAMPIARGAQPSVRGGASASGLAVSPDGQVVLYARQAPTCADSMLIEHFR
jgi:hypothetical protein